MKGNNGNALLRCAVWLCMVPLLLLSACAQGEVTPPPPDESISPTPTAPQAEAAPFALPWYGSGAPDPLGTDSAVNLTLFPLIYEGLFALDHAFVPQPVLCTRAEMGAGGTLWTFFLREGVVFSDGTPLTPQLVRDCLRMLANGSAVYAPRLANVAGIEAAEGRVVVTLHRPNADFPALLDLPIFLPGDPTIGTGPYLFTADALERAQGWWQSETLPIQRIALVPVTSADELIHAFDAGQLALVTADLTGSNPLGYAGGYELWEHPTTTMLYLGYQTSRGPCADAALRRALALCVDRTTITVSLLAGHATPAVLPIHPAAWRSSDLDAAAAYHPQTADALLDELGYTAGEDGVRRKGRTALELTLLVNNENPFKLAVAEYLADDLGKRGIVVTLKRLGFEAYESALQAGGFDLYLAETRLAPDFDLTALLTAGGALNFGGYHDSETAALLAALRAAGRNATAQAPPPDANEAAAPDNLDTAPAPATALYTRLAEQTPITPLCFKSGAVLARWGMVSGASPAPGNVFYQFRQWRID